jgi:hypothetical protein
MKYQMKFRIRRTVWAKRKSLGKKEIFGQKGNLWAKRKSLGKKEIFGQKGNLWAKRKSLGKKEILDWLNATLNATLNLKLCTMQHCINSRLHFPLIICSTEMSSAVVAASSSSTSASFAPSSGGKEDDAKYRWPEGAITPSAVAAAAPKPQV